jgi:hypothetical protein
MNTRRKEGALIVGHGSLKVSSIGQSAHAHKHGTDDYTEIAGRARYVNWGIEGILKLTKKP